MNKLKWRRSAHTGVARVSYPLYGPKQCKGAGHRRHYFPMFLLKKRRLLRSLTLGFGLTVASLPLSLGAQETVSTDTARQEERALKLQDKFDANFSNLQIYDQAQVASSQAEEDALLFRRDSEALALLLQTKEIVETLGTLAPDNAVRLEVETRLREQLIEADTLVIEGLDRLNRRIDEARSRLAALSGIQLFHTRAHISRLQELRYRTMKAMAGISPTLEALGIPSDKFRRQTELILKRQAERLVALLAFSEAATVEIAAERTADPGNSSLVAAYTEIQAQHEQELNQLIQIADALEQLGVNVSGYREVIVKQRGVLSVDIFKGRVLKNIVSEYLESVKIYLQENAVNVILKTIFIILIFLVARILSKLARRAAKIGVQRSKSGLSQLHKNVLVSASGGAVMGIGLLIIISQLGISLGPMLAGLGIVGFIVGFALQDSLANFAAGGMILIYKPFDVDDFVHVAGQEGLVKKMSLVSTTINTFDNQTLIIPNSKIWGDVIRNVTAQRVRRVDLEFRVSYRADIEKVERILTEVAVAHPKVLEEPETRVRVGSLDDSSMNFLLRPWAKRDDVWDVRWDLIRAVKLRFDEEGIEIPFPQSDVHISYTNKETGSVEPIPHQGNE